MRGLETDHPLRLGLCLVAFGLFASPVAAQTVLSVAPTVRVDSGEDSTQRNVLSEDEQGEFRLVITTRNGRYFWSSREGRELRHSGSGPTHYFIDPRGGGYVKVLDTAGLPDFLSEPGPRFRYMEHLTLLLGTITYWGSTNTFSLDGQGPEDNR